MLEDGPKLRLFARVSLRFSRSASDSRLRDHLLFFCNWKSHPWNILPGTKCHPNITNYLPQNLHHSHTQKKIKYQQTFRPASSPSSPSSSSSSSSSSSWYEKEPNAEAQKKNQSLYLADFLAPIPCWKGSLLAAHRAQRNPIWGPVPHRKHHPEVSAVWCSILLEGWERWSIFKSVG